MDFTLVDQAALVLVNKLNWIFNGDDVVMALGIDLVKHGRQRCGLSRSCWAGHKHQAARLFAQLGDNRGQIQLLKTFDLKWNYAVNSSHRSALVETVTAETGQALQSE